MTVSKVAINKNTQAVCSGSQATITFSDYCVPTDANNSTPEDDARCASLAGVKSLVSGQASGSSGGYCDTGANCAANSTGGCVQITIGGTTHQSCQITYTGKGCTPSQPAVAGDNEPMPDVPGVPDGACSYNADGSVKSCIPVRDTGCGYVNGDFQCTGDTAQPPNCGMVNGVYDCVSSKFPDAQNPCVITAGGNSYCRDGTPTPPAPDNGTAGQAANPQAQVQVRDPLSGVAGTFNWYNQTTILNSTGGYEGLGGGGAPGTTGSSTGSTTGGECTGEDCGEGEGQTGGVGATCAVAPSCSDATSIECAILTQQWTDTCRTYDVAATTEDEVATAAGVAVGSDADAVATLKHEVGIAGALGLPSIPGMSGAACPSLPSFEFNGDSFELNTLPLCDFLRIVGLFVVMLSSFAAFKIAFGST